MKMYKSKLGLELIIPLSILFGWILFDLISQKAWVGVALIVGIVTFLVYGLLSISYVVKEEQLTIKLGVLSYQKIDIHSIYKISETYNPLSSPAASIDRVEIMYNKFDSILVSPKDKKGFIENLTSINPNIEIIYRKQ